MNFRKAVFILAIFLTLSGVHLFIYAKNIGLKYRITDLKIKNSELNSQNRILGNIAAKEENLSLVEKTAKEKLGMIYPEKIIYLTASTSKTSPPAPTAERDLPRDNKSTAARL